MSIEIVVNMDSTINACNLDESGKWHETSCVYIITQNGQPTYHLTQELYDGLRDYFTRFNSEPQQPQQPEQSPSALLNDVFQIIGQRPFTLSVGNHD